jgi:spore germination protein GerM
MQKRLLAGAILSISLLAQLSGCGQAKTSAPDPGAAPGKEPVKTNASQPSQAPVQDNNKPLQVKVYYGDETGDRLIEQVTTISVKQDSDKYAAALKALSQSPDSKRIALLQGFTVKSAELKNQLLTVDVSMAPEARLGSGGENLLLQAFNKTLFQFSEIQSIELLVDGKKVDSLMGHMELPHPIKRG